MILYPHYIKPLVSKEPITPTTSPKLCLGWPYVWGSWRGRWGCRSCLRCRCWRCHRRSPWTWRRASRCPPPQIFASGPVSPLSPWKLSVCKTHRGRTAVLSDGRSGWPRTRLITSGECDYLATRQSWAVKGRINDSVNQQGSSKYHLWAWTSPSLSGTLALYGITCKWGGEERLSSLSSRAGGININHSQPTLVSPKLKIVYSLKAMQNIQQYLWRVLGKMSESCINCVKADVKIGAYRMQP